MVDRVADTTAGEVRLRIYRPEAALASEPAPVVALRARDAGAPRIGFQLLIYPDLDFRRENDSITRFAGRFGNIEREAQFWFMDHYLETPEQRLDPRVSPLLEPDLSGLPPAWPPRCGATTE
ncbi:hypothetical protein GCM10011492_23080 [Flexivirga endophytica]|uniref:Alpha/beta hydrolase fold-3 domain-containing protein n=1 Tax=Flexivirga endophytica TaxID=1849103 RepID=A0A916T505_9MICO|nr:alpha/beta hydrolase fold domain-containing protein [Flexivirga endophytica]GGB31806.1 hypothetical protein GCM10011492_23080 [Flexivirga endophytica]GHB52747.1 hypothetical protein GCM10008112_22350 [Flexivirga endophytica]